MHSYASDLALPERGARTEDSHGPEALDAPASCGRPAMTAPTASRGRFGRGHPSRAPLADRSLRPPRPLIQQLLPLSSTETVTVFDMTM